ncbi:MAG: hypothetical protein HOC20_07415 [Chloroflexi bacterium]|jgi:hypothetical protein|nr:hypothetical protein [Chloroflexota bacterium]
MIQETFNTGSVFDEAFVLGVNPVLIFMANVLWWGILQSVFAYYFANTIVKRNDSQTEKMGKWGWILAIGINAFFFSVLALESNLPGGTRTGYLASVILILSAIVLLIALKNQKTKWKLNASVLWTD